MLLRPVSNPPNPYISAHHEWLEPPPRAQFEVYEETAKSILSENDMFLTLFAPEAMDFLKKNNLSLHYDNQAILRSLENYRRPWPKPLIENLLEQYRPSAYGKGDVPGWHFASVLHTAAYCCLPADAAGSAFVRDYLQNPPKARPREMEEFFGIIRFRTGMHGHLLSA